MNQSRASSPWGGLGAERGALPPRVNYAVAPGWRLAIGCLAAAVLVAAGPRFARPHAPPAPRGPVTTEPGLTPSPSLGNIRPAPGFALLDPDGRPLHLADFRGRVVLLSFIYTSCPGACPLVSRRMALLQARLAAARLFPGRVAFLSVTVDPERDGADALARYAAAFGARRFGWWFLRESADRLAPVLAAYDEWTRRLPDGEIDHPARLYLIDPRGWIREIYSLSLFDERQAFLDIRALLAESG